MELIHSVFISAIFSIALVLYFLNYKSKPRKDRAESLIPTPPGTTGWPLIGETLEYLSTTKAGIPEKFINDRRKRYSSKLFKTSLLGQPTVLLCNADGNKFIFSNENKLVTSWWPSSVDKFFDTQNASKTEESMKMRKFVTPVLKPDTLRKYVHIVDAITRQHLRDHWGGKQVVEVYPFAKDLTFVLACRLLLGIDDEEAISQLQKPFAHFSAGLLSLPLDLPGTNFRRAIKAAKQLRNEFEVMIKRWKTDTSQSQGILSQHLVEINEEGQSTSESEMATRILALISASYDNVSTAMTFVIKYLAEMPNVYDAVLREQMGIAKAKEAEVGLNWDDIQKMRYSWNVASEVLRLHPPANGAFREVIHNFMYAGYLIPKGWKLHWNAFATHKSAEYFPEPEKFEPSRFEGNGIVPYSYVPFGGGAHMCPGKEYARIAMLVLMHNVVTNFKLEKVFPNEKVIGLPVLRPAKGLPLRLHPQHSLST
ncbi:beta-amyrin 28-monooxygenase isoform X1 [Ricinus communis]|uniref:beta-amyrin 28-monooxygenase isoform X1 n=2 Tax=Ricinus communis TaxID=3988 RepID=UPI00201B1DA9|nr:beta-amyrin 28-monooxygenase isoform X1 [Ricinus communis]